MNATLEHIKQEIKALPTDEKLSLWRDLGHDLGSAVEANEDSVEAAWDAEIESRLNDVASDKVQLVDLAVVDAEMAALFAKNGLLRQRSYLK